MARINNIRIHEVGRDPLYKTWHALDDNGFIYIHSGAGDIVFSNKTNPIKKVSFALFRPESSIIQFRRTVRFINAVKSISWTSI